MTGAEEHQWVEQGELACPGCRDAVPDDPPTTHQPGEEPLSWSHRDGSPLCGQPDGAPAMVEPIQWWEPR